MDNVEEDRSPVDNTEEDEPPADAEDESANTAVYPVESRIRRRRQVPAPSRLNLTQAVKT